MVSTTTITFIAWLAFDCISLQTHDVNSEDDYDDNDGVDDTDDNDGVDDDDKDRDDDSYEK